ncbi:MAG: PKD domain-containing protein [Actinomycetales bacterium]
MNADHGQQVVSDDPVGWTPHIMDGSVKSITQLGDTIYAVGDFTTVRQTWNSADITRNGIFAFSATTGAIDMSFNPDIPGTVMSIDNDGANLYVGGAFSSVGGDGRFRRLVRLSPSGSVVGSLPRPESQVTDVVVRGTRLFIGGKFTSVGGQSRGALAAIDLTTEQVMPSVDVPLTGTYNGGVTGIKRFDMTPDGEKLVAIGNFVEAAGQPRAQMVVIDTPSSGNASVASWATDRFDSAHNRCARVFDTFMRDVDVAPDGSYAVVTTTGAFAGGVGSGTLCDTSSRWELAGVGSGQQPTWATYTGGDTTYGVAVTGAAVYVAGHQRWQDNPYQGDRPGPGSVAREGIAALDPVNGMPLNWNPGRVRGVGAEALFATPAGLWVGSDTDFLGGERHGRMAFLPLDGGTTIPQFDAATLPNDLLFTDSTDPSVLMRRSVDASASPTSAGTEANAAIDWTSVRGATRLGTTLYYGDADGNFYARDIDPDSAVVGPAREVDLHDDPDDGVRIPFAIANLTGLAFDTGLHRLYYTVAGDSRLFYRYFTPESEKVGSVTFTADANGVDFSQARGLLLTDSKLVYGSTDGSLRTVSFAAGAVSGTASVVSSDGTWSSRVLFAGAGVPAPNQPPTASFTYTCDGARACSFDGSGSSDTDGTVTDWQWNFGDAGTASGATAAHTYATDGAFTVTLTVTDDEGATDSTTQQVSVEQATSQIDFVAAESVSGNSAQLSVAIPAEVQPDDVLVLTLAQAPGTVSAPSGWQQAGQQVSNSGDLTTTTWVRVAQAGDAGTNAQVDASGYVKMTLSLAVYRGVDPTAPVASYTSASETTSTQDHTTPDVASVPDGAWVLSFWADRTSSTTDWAPPAGESSRAEAVTVGGGRVTSLLTDGGGPTGGTHVGVTANANSATWKAVMVTIVLRPV